VTVFHRYASELDRALRLGILGDSFPAVSPEQPTPWPDELERLWEQVSGQEMELLNLAAPDQNPEEGLDLLSPLAAGEPVDVVLLAYGYEAALNGEDPRVFRDQWYQLLARLEERVPALVVVVTPPPLAANRSGRSSLAWAQEMDQWAGLKGLPIVRAAAVLGRRGPEALSAEGNITETGRVDLGAAVVRLLRTAQ
jgi:hypothetical protein